MPPFRRALLPFALGLLMMLPHADGAAQDAPARGPGQRAPVARVGDQAIAFPAAGSALRLPAFASAALDRAAPQARRVVVVLHGTLRNADVYLDGMMEAVDLAGRRADTLVVAPQFLADADASGHALPDDMPRWTLGGWKEGAGAIHPAGLDPVAGSSFAALDAVLGHFADRARYPALDRLVVAGHSAGGQVLARYAATSRGDRRLRDQGVGVRYVIANPSSYLYFDDRRPTFEAGATAPVGFRPYPAESCPGFDRYKDGLEAPVPYVGAAPAADITRRFLARDVVYLLGGADNDPRHRFLDRSCAARAQGPHRLARGQAYLGYLDTLPGDGPPGHHLLIVPEVGHDGRAMFGSAQGRAAVFDDEIR